MNRAPWLTGLVLAGALLAGCKAKDDTANGPTGELSGCDPTQPALCALPWPSDYFTVEDPSTPTGRMNHYGETALPINRDHVKLDPTQLNEKDGYSVLQPLLVWFDNLSLDNVVGHDDIGASLSPDATIAIVNAETGERAPYFAELDMTADDPHRRSLIIRPVQPLEHATRYIVGIRGLKTTSGSDVELSPAFVGLRDGDDSAHDDVPLLRDRYDNRIFPVLEDAGFERSELQLAWEFTTVSRENLFNDIQFMRDDALERVGDGPVYTLGEPELGDCAGGDTIHTTIEGKVTVPRYTDIDLPGSVIVRGEDGKPAYQADTEANFLIRIPCSVAEAPGEAELLLQYGHGLLGDRGEARTSWLSRLANERKWVVFAMDWDGMATRDVPGITLMMAGDVSGFRMIPERSEQGLVQKVVGMRMMQTSIVDDPALEIDGVKVLEGLPRGYYGNSQGGILGAAYMSVSPDIQRGVLGVPGMPYSMLLSRSLDFDPFFLIFKEKYLDHREISLILMMMQTLWDAGEPSGYAHALNDNPLEDTPAKQVLLQVGIGDSQVTPLGAHVMARAYGATTVQPQTRPIWGVDEQAPGFTGSAIVEFDYTDVPEAPFENLPPEEGHDTHECPRREPAGQAQVADFLLTGTVNHYCDGPCVSLREGLCD